MKLSPHNVIALAMFSSALIIGSAIYLEQVHKDNSIAQQQEQERVQKQAQDELEAKRDDCKNMTAGVRARWNNIIGVVYDSDLGECSVTYTDSDGTIESAPLSDMQDAKAGGRDNTPYVLP